ncbi:histidine kinase [Arcicella sp. DC2W]|uniref:Histidine kinase n=1 Tax=Arcicella gelida TaxID=2984195 RepID=A0ABU5S714_9BACT|nr:histidine kinase [Arcicella sp. DC2W]MEA5404043.1 histidine kinase [Arcicella sp. DC2W]
MEKVAELFLKIYPLEGVSAKKRVLLHCTFWLMMFVALWKSFMIPLTSIGYNFISISYLVSLDIIYFYTIIYIIIPLWTNYYEHKFVTTILLIIFLILCFFAIFFIRIQLIFDYNLVDSNKVDFRYLKKVYTNYSYFLKSAYVFIGILEIFLTALPAFFIKLTRSLVKSISEKKQVEIDYLRSQINPHFLTNTLNNIYSLSVTDDKRNSDAILSLSSLLDYVLYESNQPTISLEKEVSFLSNFIELEKMRNTKRLQVNFEIDGNIHGNIPPMILITFVENAFKHCIGDLYSNSFIKILLKVEDNKLYFEVENSKSNLTNNNQRKTFGGIGLANVKKRLATLYSNNHSLEIHDKKDTYVIILRLGLM